MVLDLLLIPRYGVMGAAAASTATYLLADAALITLLFRVSRRESQAVTVTQQPAEVPT